MSIFIKYIYILTHEKVDVKVKQGNTNKTPYRIVLMVNKIQYIQFT